MDQKIDPTNCCLQETYMNHQSITLLLLFENMDISYRKGSIIYLIINLQNQNNLLDNENIILNVALDI